MTAEMTAINYTNFKDSMDPNDKDRKNAYNKVWVAMFNWQDEEYPDHLPWWEQYRKQKEYKYNNNGKVYTTLADHEDDQEEIDWTGGVTLPKPV